MCVLRAHFYFCGFSRAYRQHIRLYKIIKFLQLINNTYITFLYTHILHIDTPRPNTNRFIHVLIVVCGNRTLDRKRSGCNRFGVVNCNVLHQIACSNFIVMRSNVNLIVLMIDSLSITWLHTYITNKAIQVCCDAKNSCDKLK
jgi:hypothetical protein